MTETNTAALLEEQQAQYLASVGDGRARTGVLARRK